MCQVGDLSRRIGSSHVYNILTCTNNYNHNSYSMKMWHASTIDNEQTHNSYSIMDCNTCITNNMLFLYFYTLERKTHYIRYLNFEKK